MTFGNWPLGQISVVCNHSFRCLLSDTGKLKYVYFLCGTSRGINIVYDLAKDRRSSCHLHVLLHFLCILSGGIYHPRRISWIVMNEPTLTTPVVGSTWRKCCKTNLKPLKGGIILYAAGSNLLELAAQSNSGDKEHQLFHKGKDKSMAKPLGTWQGCLLNNLHAAVVEVGM